MRVKGMGIIKRGIAVGLIALMACVNPLQTLSPANGAPSGNTDALTGLPTEASAAEKSEPYVGEVRLAVDKDASKAKQILEDAGYEVIDQDLNEKAGSFWNDLGDQAVFMGIKRTADEKKAIRDMKTMNMLGKYSYSDLKSWVENNRNVAKEKCSVLLEGLKEYRANVKNKDHLALQIKEVLDTVIEDDSGKTIGELFLKESCDEEELVKIILEGNNDLVNTILQGLTMALEETDDTWLDRLSTITKKSLTKRVTRELFGVDQVIGEEKKEVERYIDSEYDEVAHKILERWDGLRDAIVEPDETNDITDADRKIAENYESEEAYLEYLEETTKLRNNALVDRLKEIPYNGKTMLDLFKVDKSVFEKDITKLYPIAAALSSGQKAMIDFIGLNDLTEYALSRSEARKAEGTTELNDEGIDSLKDSLTGMSVYEGVDRAIFEEGAAMTSRTTEAFQSAESNRGDEMYKAFKYARTACIVLGAVDFIYICNRGSEWGKFSRYYNDPEFHFGLEDNDGIRVEGDATFENEHLKTYKKYVEYGKLLIIINIIAALVTTSLYVISQVQQHNRKQLEIPTVIVDRDVESNITGFVAYSAVLWNKNRNDDSGRDDRGDLNGDAGDQWLALYTTTDKSVGDPILADSITAKTGKNGGKTMPDGSYYALTMFGNYSPQNLVDENYSYNDKVDGIWMWYKKGTVANSSTDELVDDREDETTEEAEAAAGGDENDQQDAEAADADAASGEAAETTGSNIAGGSIVIFITLGAVGGFIIGMICMYFIRRKKVAPVSSPEEKK